MHPNRSSATRWLAVACLLAAAIPARGRAAVLTVGAGQTYATLGAAVAAAAAGDTIDVTAGTYTDQTATINVPLTIQGVGGTPVFTADQQLDNDKGFLVVNANLTVDHIEFANAVADPNSSNGAGIRYQAGDLSVIDSVFLDNQDGILATGVTPAAGTLTVTGSSFVGNGVGSGPYAGSEHALYAGDLAQVTVTGSSFEGTLAGHDIKSRAVDTIVENDTLDDGVTGTTSYAIDLPNGGEGTIIGNTISQGPQTQNPIMVVYGEEGVTQPDNNVLVDGNVFTNTLTGTDAFGVVNLSTANTPTSVTVSCNAFNGVQVPVYGPVTVSGNLSGSTLPACAAIVSVPEPACLPVMAFGFVLLAAVRLRRPAVS